MNPYDMALFIYNLTLLPVIFFSLLFLILTFLALFSSDSPKRFPKLKKLPFVTVHIPTFNDPIAARCVEKCLQFDYPKDKYEIIIADDSTNPETQRILKSFEERNPGLVKYIHRTNREGFKPGALRNAMKHTRGEIIVVFDSDWIPEADFLKKIVRPFADPKVAIVQSRQGFYNKDTNIITRFASYLLMIYHTVIMPLHDKANTVFFCGTAGALRRSAFEEVGGWNAKSITEDSDLSVKLFLKGYRSVYLEFETPSEVPDTMEGFLKQQMRWCYGNARVFFDNFRSILLSSPLSLRQRIMILYVTLGNLVAPLIVLMTIAGFAGWFLGEPQLFQLKDVVELASRFLFTAGFFFMGAVALHQQNLLGELKQFLISSMSMGLVLAVANSYALYRAVFNKKLHWFCTPKAANTSLVEK